MKKLTAVILLIVLLTGGFFGYQGYKRSRQKELFEEASVFFEEKDYQKAIQIFEQAKEKNSLFSGSMDRQLLYYEAEAYMNLGEYKEAIQIYNYFIGEKPKEEMNYTLKGYCYEKAKEYDKAAIVYVEAYNQTKEGTFLLKLCNMYIRTKDYDKALEIIAEHGEIKEEEIQKALLFAEIVICEKQQNYEEAYEKAKAFHEKYPEDEDGKKEVEFLESRQ